MRTDVLGVAAGGWHTMVLKTDGTVWGAGENNEGRLADGTSGENRLGYVQSKDGSGFITGQ